MPQCYCTGQQCKKIGSTGYKSPIPQFYPQGRKINTPGQAAPPKKFHFPGSKYLIRWKKSNHPGTPTPQFYSPGQQNKIKIDPPDAKAAPHNFIQKNQSTGVSSAHPKIPCTGSKSLIHGEKNQITRGHPRRDFIRQAAKQKRLIDWLIHNFIPSAENTAQQFTHATPTLVGRGSGPKPAPTPPPQQIVLV